MSLVSSVDLDKPGSLDNVEKALREATSPSNTNAPDSDNASAKADPSSVEASLPAKLRGKSVTEIAAIYQELERDYGRMANDLGVQRKLTDRLLDLDRNTNPRQAQAPQASPTVTELTSTELLTDPAKAITKVINERAQQLTAPTQQKLHALEMQLEEERFLKKHPTCKEVSTSPEFKEWIASSPVRQRAADQAAKGDISAADALFSDYERHIEATKAAAASTTPADDPEAEGVRMARRVGLESGGGSTASAGKAHVYKRADLIRLRIERPDVYSDPAFQEEIFKAYAEGRVR